LFAPAVINYRGIPFELKAQAMLLDIRLDASGSGDKTQADTAGALEGNSLVLSRSKGRIEG